MPVEILVRATSNVLEKRLQKGEIVSYRDVSKLAVWPWGNKERLPDYVIIRVTDATANQGRNYVTDLTDILQWELLDSNAQGRRYRIYIHPKVLAVRPGMKAKYRDFLVDEYGASVVSADLDNGEFVADIPNTDWQALAQTIRSNLEERVADRRYKVSGAVVDIVAAAGGHQETTKAILAANLIDRLE